MKPFAKLALIASTMAISSQSFAADAVSPVERAKIEGVIHEYLIKNPQVLVEAMQVLQRQQNDQAQEAVKLTQKVAPSFANALFHQASDPFIGNPNGKITITEFFDYQCPHCIDMVPVITAIVKANPDVRVVFKEFPIRGPVSDFAARAALSANLQGKYEVFSHALLAISKQPLTEDIILQTAKSSGLDMDKLKKDINSDAIKNQVKANVKLAQDLKLFGTPALFIGKTSASGKEPINYLPGQADLAQLQGLVNQAR